MRPSHELGRRGEDLAAAHLAGLGMRVLARNWRCARGELDLVCLDVDGTVVFVEVKARSGLLFGEPAEAVSPRKARRIRQLALAWLGEHPQPGRRGLRFDVVGVLACPGRLPTVEHLRGAF